MRKVDLHRKLGLPDIAGFTANQTSGSSPLTVQFTDTSTNTPTAWNWSYRNWTTEFTEPVYFSTAQNPVEIFTTGNRTIALNASNSAGSNTTPSLFWINVSSGVTIPVCTFTTNWIGSLPITKSADFNDTSINTPTSWEWNMGDGTANLTTQNITYKWTKRGYWTVTLTATNAAGSNSNYTIMRVVGG